MAILNSNVINWYYANNFSNNSELTVNISKTYLEMLPIPKVDEKSQNQVMKIIDVILSKKEQDPFADTTKEERLIDILVYHLYGLPYEEAKMIDESLTLDEFNE